VPVIPFSIFDVVDLMTPTDVETLGPMNTAASSFLAELGRKISAVWRRSGQQLSFSVDIS